ncbi:hypothetical protein [Streptomyces sp. TRM49041]|uniref:hypothetical protein n=1 Tax=Streptomyces sp. TRM49041 TaxID=2603216 RepID=UPI0011EC71BD|nr:hypothetical protein [Streptomyces sp. TRM49041]
MTAAILILALLFVAFVALGVYVSVKVVGAAKRGVDRTIHQARRTVEDTTLRAKSYGQGGVVGELAQLRLSLRTSMRATQDALEAHVGEDASLQESLELFRRLSAHGHELDDDLKRMERDPDRARVAERLDELRERTRRVTESADSLRWAARDRAQNFAKDDLDTLSAQIDVEAGALRHWTESGAAEPGAAAPRVSEPGAPGPGVAGPGMAGPGRSAASGASQPHRDRTQVSWPEVPTAQGADQVWPAEADAEPDRQTDEAEGGRRAITARDPRLESGYPWQKSARPETTN